jgi:hypothetical protein
MIATKIKKNLTQSSRHLKLKFGDQAKEPARWLLQVYQKPDDLGGFLRVYEPAIALNSEHEKLLL